LILFNSSFLICGVLLVVVVQYTLNFFWLLDVVAVSLLLLLDFVVVNWWSVFVLMVLYLIAENRGLQGNKDKFCFQILRKKREHKAASLHCWTTDGPLFSY
jgi:hypothetical protein